MNKFDFTKGGFFSESEIRSSNLQISKMNYSKSLSWTWILNKLLTLLGGKFKFQAQDSNLEFLLEIGQTRCTFWKNATFNKNMTTVVPLDPLILSLGTMSMDLGVCIAFMTYRILKECKVNMIPSLKITLFASFVMFK